MHSIIATLIVNAPTSMKSIRLQIKYKESHIGNMYKLCYNWTFININYNCARNKHHFNTHIRIIEHTNDSITYDTELKQLILEMYNLTSWVHS